MKSAEIYLSEVESVLPRLLSLFDANPVSPTCGQGDRFRWAWKLIDFGGGTYQGAAHGLAVLLAGDLLPAWFDERAALRRLDAIFTATRALTRRNGSVEQAFPYEASFGATGFLAYDLLAAIETLGDRPGAAARRRYLDVARPLIGFLHRGDETHGLISNHLAGAAAALYRWTALTGEPGERRGRELLDRVLEAQSPEGWFREYDGADPGYQSRGTCYLADLHRLRPDLELGEPLRRSMRFLAHFAHPDGSFGGIYGSRNTRFLYPAGIETLAPEMPEAAGLARFMRASIPPARTVTLRAMDDANLVPLFNAYCVAAAVCARRDESAAGDAGEPPPAQSAEPFRRHWPEAGLVVDKGERHYTIISTHKGGVCYHFRGDGAAEIDAGVVAQRRDGRRFSTQTQQPENRVDVDDDVLRVTATLAGVRTRLPGPWQFIVLRLLNVTVMRSVTVGNWIKGALVRLLITGRDEGPARNVRTIRLGPDLSIDDRWEDGDGGLVRCDVGGPFTVIHMASAGYWQVQDDESRRV